MRFTLPLHPIFQWRPCKSAILGGLVLFGITHQAQAQRFGGQSSQVEHSESNKSTERAQANFLSTNTLAGPLPTITYTALSVRWKAALLSDGDFTKAIKETEGAAPKTGSLGANFVRMKKWTYPVPATTTSAATTDTIEVAHLVGNFLVSLGSQGDTLSGMPDTANTARILNQGQFGQALLLPGSNAKAARSLTATLIWRPYLLSKNSAIQGISFNLFTNVTQTRWAYQKKIEDVRIVSMSAGLYYNVFDIQAKDKDDNTVKLDVYVNYAFRSIGGDIREEPEILEKAFGSKRYSYHGFEPGLVFSVNSLRLAANFPLFGHSIKGFSNGQFVGNLGFSTALNLTR